MGTRRSAGKFGTSRRKTARAHHRQFSRSSTLYSGARSADWIRVTAISRQLADSTGLQRARTADEFGREGRPISQTDQDDGASGQRIGHEKICWLAPDAPVVLPEPRGPGEVAATFAHRDNRAARTRRSERDARGAHFVRYRTHRDAPRN